MRIEVIPCLKDNYAYLVSVDDAAECLVVDPSEALPVEQALERYGLCLTAILNTHHHHDHVGGNAELVRRHPGIEVFGHTSDRGRIPEQTRFLEHAEEFRVAELSFGALHIPGHTTGALAYVSDNVVFTGDTLFAAGCGRLFEGTPRDMYESLNSTLAALPDKTRVYFGHEYTENNLRFAATLEPSNNDIRQKARRIAALRTERRTSVPTTLSEERATNPFLRTNSTELIRSLGLASGADPVEVLAAARAAKDRF